MDSGNNYSNSRTVVGSEIPTGNSVFRPDFIVLESNNAAIAVDVMVVRSGHYGHDMKRISDHALAAYYAISEGLFKSALVIVVTESLEYLIEIAARFEKSTQKVKQVEYKFAYLSPSGSLETF